MKCTFIFGKRSSRIFSIPSNVMFARRGEIIAPCGAPLSVWQKASSKMKPDFRNWDRIDLSVGMLFLSQEWEMLSKHPLMSPSRIQGLDVSLKRHRNAYVDASCAHLKRRKPKDRVSAVVSATG